MVIGKRGKRKSVLIFLLLVIGFMFVFQSGLFEGSACTEDETEVTCYPDGDGDGYGDEDDEGSIYCDYCSGSSVTDNTDCDDDNYSINPGETEECNGVDDDCDGDVDEDDSDVDCCDHDNCEEDGDEKDYCDIKGTAEDNECVECLNDSHCDAGDYCSWGGTCEPCDKDGDEFSVRACEDDSSKVDCLDSTFNDPEDCPSNPDSCTEETSECAICINPDAEEVCDAKDNNCDGNVDEGTGYCYNSEGEQCEGTIDCSYYTGERTTDCSSLTIDDCDDNSDCTGEWEGWVDCTDYRDQVSEDDYDCDSDAPEFCEQYCDGTTCDCMYSQESTDVHCSDLENPDLYTQDGCDFECSNTEDSYWACPDSCDLNEGRCFVLGDQCPDEEGKEVAADTESSCYEKCPGDCKCGWQEYYEPECTGSPGCDTDDCEDDLEGCSWDEDDTCSDNDGNRRDCFDAADCSWKCCTYIDCYEDNDNDTEGGEYSEKSDCEGNCDSGLVSNNDDCDDSVKCLNSSTIWYKDKDGDGFINATESIQSCDRPGTDDYYLDKDACNVAYSIDIEGTDCDDSDSDVHDEITCYEDSDGDDYGNPDSSQQFCVDSCSDVDGWVDNDTDCNDDSADVNPGISTEDQDGYRCDGFDNDCDGKTDADDSDVTCCADSDCDDGKTCYDNACVEPDAYWSKEDPSQESNPDEITEPVEVNGQDDLPEGPIYLVYEYSGLSEGEDVEFEVREDDDVNIINEWGDDDIKFVEGNVTSDGIAYAEVSFTKEDLEKASKGAEESYPDEYGEETWEFYFRVYNSSDGEVYDGKGEEEDFLNLTLDRSVDDKCESYGIDSCSGYNEIEGEDAESYCEDDKCDVLDTGECEDGDFVEETCYWDEGQCNKKDEYSLGDPECIDDCDGSDQCHLEIDNYDDGETCNPDSCTCVDGYKPTDLGYCVNESVKDIPNSIGACFYEETTTDDCSEGDLLNYTWNATWSWAEDNNYSKCDENDDCEDEHGEDYTCDDGRCRYDPQNKNAECQSGSEVRACPAEIKVPFFNVYNVIAVLLVMGIVYYFFGYKSQKLSKKKKSSKGKRSGSKSSKKKSKKK